MPKIPAKRDESKGLSHSLSKKSTPPRKVILPAQNMVRNIKSSLIYDPPIAISLPKSNSKTIDDD